MSDAKDIAEHATQICVGLLAFGSGAASALSVLPVSLAALLAIGAVARRDQRRACFSASAGATLKALKDTPDFSPADLDRAALLLGTPGGQIPCDPQTLARGVAGGVDGFDARVAAEIMAAIPFEPDDHGPRAAIRLALTTAVGNCRRHPDVHRDLTQALLIDMARGQGVQVSLLTRMDSKLDQLLNLVEGFQRAGPQTYDNLLDFFEVDPAAPSARAELAVKKEGDMFRAALFHTRRFRVTISLLRYFAEDQRLVFVSGDQRHRDLGVEVVSEVRHSLKQVDQVLFVLLDSTTGHPVEGYYVPFRYYD